MERVRLGDIAEISSGSTAPKDNEFSDRGYPFIRVSSLDIISNKNKYTELSKITEEIANRKNMKLFKENTIVFAKSGMSCFKDRVLKLEQKAYIVNHLASIYTLYDKLNIDYLKEYLVWYKPSRLIIDESYPSIRLSDISKIVIPLPTIDVQSKIVDILNKIQSIIDKRKEQVIFFDKLIKSRYLSEIIPTRLGVLSV